MATALAEGQMNTACISLINSLLFFTSLLMALNVENNVTNIAWLLTCFLPCIHIHICIYIFIGYTYGHVHIHIHIELYETKGTIS